MIFEGQFENVFGHIHITTKSNEFLEIFNQLMSWKITIKINLNF